MKKISLTFIAIYHWGINWKYCKAMHNLNNVEMIMIQKLYEIRFCFSQCKVLETAELFSEISRIIIFILYAICCCQC